MPVSCSDHSRYSGGDEPTNTAYCLPLLYCSDRKTVVCRLAFFFNCSHAICSSLGQSRLSLSRSVGRPGEARVIRRETTDHWYTYTRPNKTVAVIYSVYARTHTHTQNIHRTHKYIHLSVAPQRVTPPPVLHNEYPPPPFPPGIMANPPPPPCLHSTQRSNTAAMGEAGGSATNIRAYRMNRLKSTQKASSLGASARASSAPAEVCMCDGRLKPAADTSTPSSCFSAGIFSYAISGKDVLSEAEIRR